MYIHVMKRMFYLVASGCFFAQLFIGCKEGNGEDRKEVMIVERDITITPENSFTNLFLDSLNLEEFIVDERLDGETALQMRSFYNSRNYQFAWFDQDGLTETGNSFWSLLGSFITNTKDSSLFNKELAGKIDEFINGNDAKNADEQLLKNTELELTKQFFNYAKVAYAGKVDPNELNWFIPKRKINAIALLDSLVSQKGIAIEKWEPLNEQYRELKNELIRFNKIAANGGWSTVSLGDKKAFRPGDSAQAIIDIKQRLFISGDLPVNNSSPIYDEQLLAAIEKIQKRFGLKEDGIIGPQVMRTLNVPVKDRVEQILVNLERMRWLPEQLEPTRIVVNIPEFKIHVYENGIQALEMPIVVGKAGTNTVIFKDELEYVVFSPYWNVPRSIVKNEILPAIRRNPNYLYKEQMEITGYAGGLPVIRQKPGDKNALGKVKFLFPNNYSMYFHDTPAKSLFQNERRAFSHGCMRLADAEKMANYLLRDQPEWTPEKILEAMNSGKERWVPLTNHIPVYVSYYTAWVDNDGVLNFREDIYGHDEKMAERMFL